MNIRSEGKMKVLHPLDLSEVETQLRLVMRLKGKPGYEEQHDKLQRMIARKTLEYYSKDGYHAFFHNYKVDYVTEDGYRVRCWEHEAEITLSTPYGTLKGTGSTWDYISDDLSLSPRPKEMEKREYDGIRRRMYDILVSEKILYPFHPLHNIGHGYWDNSVCMYGAHILLADELAAEKETEKGELL